MKSKEPEDNKVDLKRFEGLKAGDLDPAKLQRKKKIEEIRADVEKLGLDPAEVFPVPDRFQVTLHPPENEDVWAAARKLFRQRCLETLNPAEMGRYCLLKVAKETLEDKSYCPKCGVVKLEKLSTNCDRPVCPVCDADEIAAAKKIIGEG